VPQRARIAQIVFVGVSTGGSLVHRALPLWQPLLGAPASLRGIDLEPAAAPASYLALLEELAADEGLSGAVITSHKVAIFVAGRRAFAQLDPLALALGEVNAIRRTPEGLLLGFARDPVSVGRVLERIWPLREGHVICLGAGGTALALAHHLAATGGVERFVCADRDPAALERLRTIAGPLVTAAALGEGPWDRLLAGAPPGSLIVNATGMGKDRPGSPLSARARFPRHAVVWELNYRGELEFLKHARRQADAAALAVHDGWQLFCHGWAAALTAVLDLDDSNALGERFVRAARGLRPA
jgi:shikimate dehydrogenase